MGLCDRQDIMSLLKKYQFSFSKSLGQNFLVEESVPRAIAEACGAGKEDGVVEIGPGIGCLTQFLAQRAGQVTAIELDRRLFPVLKETLADYSNVQVIHGDVLKTDFAALCREHLHPRRVYACANLPYYITTPAIAALLESGVFQAITVMVQKEVAQRIAARPGTKEYGAFSVYVQYHAKVEPVLEVDHSCFMPQPKVDSAVVRLTPCPPAFSVDEKLYFALVKAAFGQRRKTLVNALNSLLSGQMDKEQITALVTQCGLDSQVRGERLSLQDFARLSEAVGALRSGRG